MFGSGSFGTAMASVVARNAREVVIVTRREDVARGINDARANPSHLSAFELAANVTATTDADEALRGGTRSCTRYRCRGRRNS